MVADSKDVAILAFMSRYPPRIISFRSPSPAAPHLPLRVRSVGRYELGLSSIEKPRKRLFMELFWGVRGSGAFQVEGRWVPLNPDWIFIYRTGEVHHIRSGSEGWTYCWITFDHPASAAWFESFGLTNRTQWAGKCPEPLFLDISVALQRSTLAGECQAAQLGHQILIEATTPSPAIAPGSLAERAQALVQAHFTQPGFGVTQLAAELQVHRSTLFRQFQAAHGQTPSAYLQNLRLQRGISSLRESTAPVQEIANESGFADPNYFARTVRAATGLSPRELRSEAKA